MSDFHKNIMCSDDFSPLHEALVRLDMGSHGLFCENCSLGTITVDLDCLLALFIRRMMDFHKAGAIYFTEFGVYKLDLLF